MSKKLISKHQIGGKSHMPWDYVEPRVPTYISKEVSSFETPERQARQTRYDLTHEPNDLYNARMAAKNIDARGNYPNTNSLVFDVMFRDYIGINPSDRRKESTTTIPITDPRDIDSTKKMGRNVNLRTVGQIIKGSKDRGLDPSTLLAVGLQETGLHERNPLHDNTSRLNPKLVQQSNNWDIGEHVVNSSLDFFKDKLNYAKRIGKEGETNTIQAWNGYGKFSPDRGKVYGQLGIDMNKDPIYGKRIVDLRENVIKKNPLLQKLINNGN